MMSDQLAGGERPFTRARTGGSKAIKIRMKLTSRRTAQNQLSNLCLRAKVIRPIHTPSNFSYSKPSEMSALGRKRPWDECDQRLSRSIASGRVAAQPSQVSSPATVIPIARTGHACWCTDLALLSFFVGIRGSSQMAY